MVVNGFKMTGIVIFLLRFLFSDGTKYLTFNLRSTTDQLQLSLYVLLSMISLIRSSQVYHCPLIRSYGL